MNEEPKVAKPKHVVLQEFTAILYKHDPVGAAKGDQNEYEPEALSILARFGEAGIHLADEEEAAIEAAHSIIDQTFKFWFDSLGEDLDVDAVTLELLHAYVSAFPEVKPTDLDPSEQPIHIVMPKSEIIGADDDLIPDEE